MLYDFLVLWPAFIIIPLTNMLISLHYILQGALLQ